MTTIDRNTDATVDVTTLSAKNNQLKHYGRSLRVTIAALVFALASIFVTTQGAFAKSSPASAGYLSPSYGRRVPAPSSLLTNFLGPVYGRRVPAPSSLLTNFLSPVYGPRKPASSSLLTNFLSPSYWRKPPAPSSLLTNFLSLAGGWNAPVLLNYSAMPRAK